MKKKDFLWSLLTMLMVATLSVGLSSCSKDEDPELSINSPTSLSISLLANGDGDKTITVSASHTDWSADVSYVNGSGWLTLGSQNGSSISFTVTENTTTSPRTAKVKIIATANASLTKEVTVTQAAGESSLSADKSTIEFQMDGGSQTIQVTSNTSWELKGKDSWLTVSPSSGTKPSSESETKTVTISASENTTGETRSCTLTFSTTDNKANASVTVTQRGLTGVSAEPSDELLMCYSYAHGVSCGAKTKYFYIALYNQSTYNKMSEKEVIADVVTGKVEDRESPSDDNYYSWNLSENSSYVLAIVPYGENDRQGKLYTKQIKTKSSDSEPDVEITNFSIDWATDSYVWTVTKNTYCSSYYTYAVSSKTKFPTYYWMENGSYGLIAWAIRAEMKKDNTNHLTYINQNAWKDWGYSEYTAVEKFYALQINDGVSTFAANPLSDKFIQIVVWGTKSNGDLSGMLHFGYADWSDTSANGSRAASPLKSPKKPEANGGKLKCIRANINDIKVMRIK